MSFWKDYSTPLQGILTNCQNISRIYLLLPEQVNYMRRYISLLVLCFSTLNAQELSKTDKAEEYMQAAAKAWGFSGTVLVSEKGEPFYANGFGKASYQLNVPNDSRNIFRIGGLTKTFTAAAIM